jgi:hypothetical protein
MATEKASKPDSFPQLMALFETTVRAVSQAVAIILENRDAFSRDGSGTDMLRAFFKEVFPERMYHSTGLDPHLVRGLHKHSRGHADDASLHPRLIDLVLFHTGEAFGQTEERRLARGHVLVPSPMMIAIEALTVPDEYQSRAYSLLAARTYLSRKLSVWPRNAFVDSELYSGNHVVDENTLIEEFAYCRTWLDHGDIWKVKTDPRKFFVAHYLAARGVLLLRFKETDATTFMKNGIFSSDATSPPRRWTHELQFRLSQRYSSLPAPADYMNEILGIPLAIRGSEIVFFNGIKPSANAGLVTQVSGGPGTGKTTFALALSAALASIGTQTLYFSVEESVEDLRTKLRQQVQSRLASLSYYSTDDKEWFRAYDIQPTSLDVLESAVLSPLADAIANEKSQWPAIQAAGKAIPPLPFLVVLDSLSALSLEDDPAGKGRAGDTPFTDGSTSGRRQLAAFVDLCRQMRVLVILITGEPNQSAPDLDYLVDMVIRLSVEGGNEHNQKPIRLFTLSKSRQQISRHGTHIFHLSGDSGFRLAPQLSSQMDAQQNLRQLLWDKTSYSEVLNVRRTSSGGYRYIDFMRIHWRSQILLQGKGSSGKAGLALKIALSPRYGEDGTAPIAAPSRVLVISFLYPPNYYETLKQKIQTGLIRESRGLAARHFPRDVADAYVDSMPKISVIHLSPGFLLAEDLHSKIVRKLEEGRLEGRPYSCVVIDGLHNLALQFPGAGESASLLPIIYGTLARANVTTITTFTTLSLSSSEVGASSDVVEESVFRLRVHLPLLHTLVQASDYVFELLLAEKARAVPLSKGAARDRTTEDNAKYLVSVQSAISRDPPTTVIGWRRQELEFCDPGWGFGDAQQSLPID